MGQSLAGSAIIQSQPLMPLSPYVVGHGLARHTIPHPPGVATLGVIVNARISQNSLVNGLADYESIENEAHHEAGHRTNQQTPP